MPAPVVGDVPPLSNGRNGRRVARTGARQPSGSPPAAPSSELAPEKVKWTLPLAGLLIYLVVFTSLRLPLGDVAIGLALLGMVLEPRFFRLPVPARTLAVFLIWVVAASTQSQYPEWVSEGLMDLLKLWLIVMVGYNALQSRAQIRLFMIVFLACFALWPVRGTLITFFLYGEFDNEGRAGWIQLYSNPNDLAAMTLLQLSMLAALLQTERTRWVRLAGLAGMLVLPFLIIMTQSRGVFLGLLAFLACVFTTHRRKLKLAVRLFVVAVIVAFVAPDGAWDRLGTLRNAADTEAMVQVDGEGGSARQRYEIWTVATRIIGKHPVTGVGFRAYKPAHYDEWTPDLNASVHGLWDTHSLYLNVTAETGFPGLILYIVCVLTALIPAERVRRACRHKLPDAARQLLFLEAGLLGFMVACIFGTLPYLPHMHLHMVLLYALAMVHRNTLRGDAASNPLSRLRGSRLPAGLRGAGKFA